MDYNRIIYKYFSIFVRNLIKPNKMKKISIILLSFLFIGINNLNAQNTETEKQKNDNISTEQTNKTTEKICVKTGKVCSEKCENKVKGTCCNGGENKKSCSKAEKKSCSKAEKKSCCKAEKKSCCKSEKKSCSKAEKKSCSKAEKKSQCCKTASKN